MTDESPKPEELIEHRLEKAFNAVEEVRLLIQDKLKR